MVEINEEGEKFVFFWNLIKDKIVNEVLMCFGDVFLLYFVDISMKWVFV